ncbi:MAG: tetratricopeptide repeat protein [Bacteroidota bacterium]|nr:tetratricopeptide repeat protein [Bacteroidota bacterium]
MIKKIMYLSVLLMFSITTVSAQKSIIEKSEDQVKMFNAQQRFYAGDYQGALNVYNDLLKTLPNDANILFHIAECYFSMNQFAQALDNAKKAKSIDPKANEDIALLLGKLYFMDGNVDSALIEFTAFKAAVGEGKKANESDINVFLSQVNQAKVLMAKPVNVKIDNVGEVINSEYDDKNPSITADGKTLIFTSRRPGKSSALDIEGDKKYYEDIYISRWDSVKKTWADAELVPGAINTEGHDACTSISPDGKAIFVYRNDTEGESRGGDIYFSKLSSSGKWGSPVTIGKPINTTFFEGGACISPDGSMLYFVSERPEGGFGHADIYASKRKSRTEWDIPVNLGPDVNTTEDEGGIFLAPDGKTLFLSSNGYNSMGGYDIFKTVNENGKWSKPVNLGYPINTLDNDMSLTLSVDAQAGYFTSDRKGGKGDLDIYKVDLSNYPVLEKDMKAKVIDSMAILKGTIFNATDGSAMEAEVVFYDQNGTKIGGTTSNSGSGDYFITLLAGKTYQVKIEKEGYKPVDEKVEVKAAKDGPTVLVKHYLLYKKDI